MSRDCVSEGTLQAYLDGELDSGMAIVDAHLRGCERCSAALRHLQITAAHVDRWLDSLADEAGPPAILPRPRLRHASVAAAIGLAACLAISLLLVRSRSVLPVANAPNKVPLDSYRVTQTFVPELGTDPALPRGKLMIVQVELPVSALSHDVIAAGSSDSSPRVLAEILMDEDGTTYGMRLANNKGE